MEMLRGQGVVIFFPRLSTSSWCSGMTHLSNGNVADIIPVVTVPPDPASIHPEGMT